jgi:hypothetical protein
MFQFNTTTNKYKYAEQLHSSLISEPSGPGQLDIQKGLGLSSQFLASAIVETYIQSIPRKPYFILFELQGVPDMLDISQGKLYEIKSSIEGCAKHEKDNKIKTRSDYRHHIYNDELRLILGNNKKESDYCIYEDYNDRIPLVHRYKIFTDHSIVIDRPILIKDWSDIIDALLDLRDVFVARIGGSYGSIYDDFANHHLPRFYTNVLDIRHIGRTKEENRAYINIQSAEARKAIITGLVAAEKQAREERIRIAEQTATRIAEQEAADKNTQLKKRMADFKKFIKTELDKPKSHKDNISIKEFNKLYKNNIYTGEELHSSLLKLINTPLEYSNTTSITEMENHIETINEILNIYVRSLVDQLKNLNINNFEANTIKINKYANYVFILQIINAKILNIKKVKEKIGPAARPTSFLQSNMGVGPPGASAAARPPGASAARPLGPAAARPLGPAAARPLGPAVPRPEIQRPSGPAVPAAAEKINESRKRKEPGLQKYLKYKAKYLQLKNLMKSLNL